MTNPKIPCFVWGLCDLAMTAATRGKLKTCPRGTARILGRKVVGDGTNKGSCPVAGNFVLEVLNQWKLALQLLFFGLFNNSLYTYG
jgi:hypothetical protein